MKVLSSLQVRFLAVMLLLMTVLVGAYCADDEAALRAKLATKEGLAKLVIYEKLYYMALMTDDTEKQMQCMNEWVEATRKENVPEYEGYVLVNRAMFFYANDMNDSIYLRVPADRELMKRNSLWKEYYELWSYLANTYIYGGNPNMGLKEVEVMFDDAANRENKYGMGMAYATMGNAYMTLGDLELSANSYQKSLDILLKLPTLYPVITEVYPNYGDVLNDRKDYAKLNSLTEQWNDFLHRYIKEHELKEDGYEVITFWSYYHLAKAQACLGLNELDKVADELEKVKSTLFTIEDLVGQKYLFYMAELYLRQGKYYEALRLNTQRMQLMEETDDESVLIMVRHQRAKIMERLGRYAEAASIYRDMYLINDSINSYSIKSQLNEMNTIFQVDELKMKQAKEQARLEAEKARQQKIGIIAIASIIVVSLAIFLFFRIRSAKRLKVAHEKLEDAHDKLEQAHDKLEQAHNELLTAYDNLEETTKAKERIESDLRIARDIQMSMVPAQFPDRQDVDLYASMTPAKEVGGDLYDFLLLDGSEETDPAEKLYFALGDVSGKGVPASLFMAQATRLFHTLAKLQMKPEEIATRLNDELAADNEQGMFVTMFIGVVNLKTGHLYYCNAGHNPPVLAGEFLEMIPNAPIGLWPGLEYEGEEIEDISGKPLFVYTDGLNEAENRSQEQFTDERLLEILQTRPFESARQTIEMLKEEVERHRDGAEPNDDLTMICFRVNGNKLQNL